MTIDFESIASTIPPGWPYVLNYIIKQEKNKAFLKLYFISDFLGIHRAQTK